MEASLQTEESQKPMECLESAPSHEVNVSTF